MINIIAVSPRAAELTLTLVTVRMTSNVCGLCADRKCDKSIYVHGGGCTVS